MVVDTSVNSALVLLVCILINLLSVHPLHHVLQNHPHTADSVPVELRIAVRRVAHRLHNAHHSPLPLHIPHHTARIVACYRSLAPLDAHHSTDHRHIAHPRRIAHPPHNTLLRHEDTAQSQVLHHAVCESLSNIQSHSHQIVHTHSVDPKYSVSRALDGFVHPKRKAAWCSVPDYARPCSTRPLLWCWDSCTRGDPYSALAPSHLPWLESHVAARRSSSYFSGRICIL
mmetsp:Transcript_8871/g.32753  ORF Transcript_8871/g.32753 Transcript_8871/m.32753 type:complete len:228 (+) Transcript_8871:1-684(+)